MPTTAFLKIYLLTILIGAPCGALIAKYATVWVARFKPRYTKALISTITAYTVGFILGWAFRLTGIIYSNPKMVQLLAGFLILTYCHFTLLRSESGERLSQGKAAVVAICQIIGVGIGMFIVLYLLLGVKRLFA